MGLRLIVRHVAHHTASLESPLRSPWALNPLTRDTISRLLISASWVANVMFKLPQTPRSHHCYIHSLCISALFIAFKPFICNFCSFLRALLPPSFFHQSYDFCISTTLLPCRIASLRIELPGTVYVYPLLCSSASPFFSVPFFFSLGFLAWVAFPGVLPPFLSWHHLLKTFYLSSFSSYLFTT